MQTRSLTLILLVLFLLGPSFGPPLEGAQNNKSLEVLLLELQDEKTSNDAAEEFLKWSKTDPAVRRYLVARLPDLLIDYQPNTPGTPGNFVWSNEARLAGQLKIAEAIPGLCKGMATKTGPGSGGSLGYNFFDYPAVPALISIGPPAVSPVSKIQGHGSPVERQEAAHILGAIGTAPAVDALAEAGKRESDPEVRRRIEEELKPRARRKRP